ncbi:MAG: ABC transporter ATP-binding protein, partial [Acidimicrobiia bacterium]|nr:ABC transporter ATP-binding protein [Acidimicrobiia bacterium]
FDSPDGKVHAVNGVSLRLRPGESLGIVGESGSGKSVTMMSLVGLLPSPPANVDGGTAILRHDGTEVDILNLSRSAIRGIRGAKIGFVFQDPLSALNPTMRVGEQIAESIRKHRKLSDEQAKEAAIELLAAVGIADPARRYRAFPHEFSGGMRQRDMIAIAMAADPPIIIFDEPTTALDVTVQAQIVELVKTRLQTERGTAVIWITHDLAVVAGIADRVAVMYGGTVVESGPVDEIYEHPLHPYTRGLLAAVPTTDSEGKTRLASIEGSPPDLLVEPDFCPFQPRCAYAFDRCVDERPLLREVGDRHRVACHFDLRTGTQLR